MQPHRSLKLHVHATDELEHVLGEQIVAREQLHVWPLSSVEALTTTTGKRFIYKWRCPMPIRSVQPADADEWLRMRMALWPDSSPEKEAEEIGHFFAGLLLPLL